MKGKLVVFDLVGTLIYPDPPAAEVYARWGQHYGVSLDATEIRRRLAHAVRQSDFGIGGDEEHRHVWTKIVTRVFQNERVEIDSLFTALWDHFAHPEAWRLFDDALMALDQLRSANRSVAIGSNFDSRIERILRGLDLWMEGATFWSSQLHASKPDREFFRSIERHLGVAARDCLMVGDDPENDYHGARAAGWQAALIDRTGPARDNEIVCVQSLCDIAEIDFPP